MLYILATHLSHLWRDNKTMATLDKRHFPSTYKVKIFPSPHSFLCLLFEKESNHGYFLPTHSHNPKNHTLIYNSLNQCGVKPFSTTIWFWVYLSCNDWNVTTIYGTYNVWNPCKLSKPKVISLILFLINLRSINGLKCFVIVEQNSLKLWLLYFLQCYKPFHTFAKNFHCLVVQEPLLL